METFKRFVKMLKSSVSSKNIGNVVGGNRSQKRYAKDWDSYSKSWERSYGNSYDHLGEEWNDDETLERKRDTLYFTVYAERFLSPEMTVLEVGPGGGKWTVRIAPRVKKMIVLDVSKEMLKRTKKRCDDEGISNIEYVLANGKDFQPIADESVDFFFSYDVFVHIALEDTWPYSQEIARVLAPGSRGVCHHAINSVPQSWDRIERLYDWYRGENHTLGQFYYYSPEALRRMYERSGLMVFEQHQEAWHCTCIFQKPEPAIVPRLESLLKQLMSIEANDETVRSKVLTEMYSLQDQLHRAMEPILSSVSKESDRNKRAGHVEKIRQIWRGI